jgi:hypothetical protein
VRMPPFAGRAFDPQSRQLQGPSALHRDQTEIRSANRRVRIVNSHSAFAVLQSCLLFRNCELLIRTRPLPTRNPVCCSGIANCQFAPGVCRPAIAFTGPQLQIAICLRRLPTGNRVCRAAIANCQFAPGVCRPAIAFAGPQLQIVNLPPAFADRQSRLQGRNCKLSICCRRFPAGNRVCRAAIAACTIGIKHRRCIIDYP